MAGPRRVAVFGPCSAAAHELGQLAQRGVNDAVLLAFAGSYTVVESIADRATVFTDIGHAWPVYTAKTEWGTVWGSSALALAALVGAGTDLNWVASALLAPQVPELVAGRSAFTGITAVPPGSRLVMQPDISSRVLSAWRPAPAMVDVTEPAVYLRRALSAGIATRLAASCRPSADCSGGIDSTSLALLAANQLSANIRLHAVTVHPADTITGGDLDYARVATRGRKAVVHLLCPLEARHTPFSRMTELTPPTDEPAPTTIAIARAVAEFELLRRLGSDCHFTGDGGDTLLGGPLTYLADLLRLCRVQLFAHHVIGWARLRRTTVWPLFTDALRAATTSSAASLAGLAASLNGSQQQRKPKRARWDSRSSPAPWATPHACELAADAAHQAAARRAHFGDVGIGGDQTVRAIQTVGRTARSDAQVAEHYGVRLHNPFTDAQVINACLTVPTWRRYTPYRYKPLLVAALADILPPEIAHRRTKGDFTPDHYLGLRANTGVLHELADGHLAAFGLVHPDRLRRLLTHAEVGLPVAFSDFEPVIAAEVWLRAVAAAKPAARWGPYSGIRGGES